MHELAKAWAEGSLHPDGHTFRAGNLIATHEEIFSYGRHFTIAQFLPGMSLVLFTERDYSSSTGKHKRVVGGSLHRSSGLTRLDVPTLDGIGSVETMARVWVEARINDAHALAKKALRSRKYALWQVRNAYHLLNNAALLHRTFNTPPPQPDPALWETLVVAVVKAKLLSSDQLSGDAAGLDLDPIYRDAIQQKAA
jgi:hypothetical protein